MKKKETKKLTKDEMKKNIEKLKKDLFNFSRFFRISDLVNFLVSFFFILSFNKFSFNR